MGEKMTPCRCFRHISLLIASLPGAPEERVTDIQALCKLGEGLSKEMADDLLKTRENLEALDKMYAMHLAKGK